MEEMVKLFIIAGNEDGDSFLVYSENQETLDELINDRELDAVFSSSIDEVYVTKERFDYMKKKGMLC